MDRLSRDSNNQYPAGRNDDYDTYNPSRTNNHFSNRQNYDRNNQNGYHPYVQQRSDDDRLAGGDRRYPPSRYEDERERIDIPVTTRRTNPSDQTQRSPPKVNYTINQPQQTYSSRPRSIVIDINISIGVGNNDRNPPVFARSNNFRPRSPPPIRSTATIDNVGYVDIDIRSPSRTARLSTDGLIRPSPSKQSTNHTNENNN